MTLDELLEQIKVETVKLAPYINLDARRAPRVGARAIELTKMRDRSLVIWNCC
jgi:hypothetical protein